MAQHVYSVLCRQVVVDRDGGQVSIHEVIERLIMEVPTEERLKKLEEVGALPVPLQLISWWVRSDYDKPEESSYRIILKTPKNEEHVLKGGDTIPEQGQPTKVVEDFHLNLQESTGARRIMRLEGLPRWSGFGLYWFTIEGREKNGKRYVATRIPLEVVARALPAERH